MIDFEHPTTRGATCLFLLLLFDAPCFNPRTHEGCDGYKGLSRTAPLFQSTHPRGVRQKERCYYSLQIRFQSTHPRGVRHTYLAEAAPLLSFNPRTHEGCDNKQHKNYFIALVSIHAPTRGATTKFNK